MDHTEMVALIQAGVPQQGGIWADLGAGTGNFTHALRDLVGAGATIYAIDRDQRAIDQQRTYLERHRDGATIIPRQADVTRSLDLPLLDGILMANLLHFIRDQEGFLRRLATLLKPHGRIMIVEYEENRPVPWVPFPVPFARFASLAATLGWEAPQQVGVRRSRSSGSIMYAAVAIPAPEDHQ